MSEPETTDRPMIEEIVAVYEETGSVWKTGECLGIAGQTVYKRLRAIDHPFRSRTWDDGEIHQLREMLEAGSSLGEVAEKLGRPYSGVALKASRLGIRTNQSRRRKLPRGAGFDKASTTRHLKTLAKSPLSLTKYARSKGINVDTLVMAFERHAPEDWEAYLATASDIPRKACPYCERSFIPNSGKQIYCTRKCGADARRDEGYFGGKRRDTIGLAEGTCQLCGRDGVKGLSSHHVFGKENDPDNEALVALCRGCHQLVGRLGARKFVGEESVWEALIGLSWMRHHGGKLPDGIDGLHVMVDIDYVIAGEE